MAGARFNPTRSSKSTFVNRIVNRRIISILRHRYAQRRDYRRSVALDEAMANQEDSQLEPVNQRRAYADPPSDLAIDLAHAIASLDGDTRHTCGLLMHESIAETARRLGLTRAEARTRIAKIRKQFTDAGLEVYVNESAARPGTDCVCRKRGDSHLLLTCSLRVRVPTTGCCTRRHAIPPIWRTRCCCPRPGITTMSRAA